MFKRVKSLVLAGALVLGMAVPAFAADTAATLKAVKDNYLKSMTGVGSRPDGSDIRTITKDDYVSAAEWQKFINGINNEKKIKIKVMEGGVEVEKEVDTNNRLVITAYDEKTTQYKVYFDADSDNAIDDPGDDILIETINIEINNDAAQGKGLIGDIISPETGDMIAYGGLAIAAIAGAGLYISNKKRK